MSIEFIHEVLQGQHLEEPDRSFLVRFRHKAYRPEGFSITFRARDVLAEVQCETEHGALEIARAHHRQFGEDFALEQRPWRRGNNHEVIFEDVEACLLAA